MNEDINKKALINQKENNEIFPDLKNKKDDLSETLRKWVDKGKIKVEFAGKEYELETTSYDFEYPERIQKETGILGYKRTIIKDADILRIAIEYLKSADIQDFEGYDKTFEKYKDIDSLYTKGLGTISNRCLFNENITKKLDMILSNGEFPNRTFNHVMGSYHEGKEKMHKHFIEDKFFLQKIFDINLSQKIKLGNRAFAVDATEPILMNVYEKNNNKLIQEIDTHNLNKMAEKIKKDEVYIIGYDAFNTHTASFWKDICNNPSFGFTLNDSFFKEYIKKVYEFLLINNYDTKKELIGIEQILKILAFCDNDFYENYKKLFNEEYKDEETRTKERKKINPNFTQIRKEFLPSINQDEAILNKNFHKGYNERFVDAMNDIEDSDFNFPTNQGLFQWFLLNSASTWGDSGMGKKSKEVYFPIFINHDKIPQISWGHAKYAHFFNKKGFSFFEFKHADHLPPKE